MRTVQIPRVGMRFPLNGTDQNMVGNIALLAHQAESGGFDALWVDDCEPTRAGSIGGYTALGMLGVWTSSAMVGVYPSDRPMRSPAMLAKIVSSTDVITKGRAMLGIGALSNNGDDMDLRFTESLEICYAMLTQDLSTFEGRFHHVTDAPNRPGPVRANGVPIVVVTRGGYIDPMAVEPICRWADAVLVEGPAESVAITADVLRRSNVDQRPISLLWSGSISGAWSVGQMADHVGAIAHSGAVGCVVSVDIDANLDLITATLHEVFG